MSKIYVVFKAYDYLPVCYYTDENKAIEHAAQIVGSVFAVEPGILPREKDTRCWCVAWPKCDTWGELLTKKGVEIVPISVEDEDFLLEDVTLDGGYCHVVAPTKEKAMAVFNNMVKSKTKQV